MNDPFDLLSVEDPEDDWEIPDYDREWLEMWQSRTKRWEDLNWLERSYYRARQDSNELPEWLRSNIAA